MVERSAVNPWSWSLTLGFNQGELVASLAFPESLIEVEAIAVA
jgi:hypothetical protein